MRLEWDQVGKRTYETGVDHGVHYLPDTSGAYTKGVAWNGLITVTERPTGAESSPQYADNIKYLNIISAEDFEATIEAFSYPDQFAICDGTAELIPGVTIGQQPRSTFGLCFRTLKGNDVAGQSYGYKLHLIYGAQAAPSERPYGTINESPEPISFSWELTTTPVPVAGYQPTAILTVDSTKFEATAMKALEDVLYGTDENEPRLPLPNEVAQLLNGGGTEVASVAAQMRAQSTRSTNR